MAITVPYQAPIANVAAGQLGPNIFSARPYGTGHIAASDFVILDGSHAGYIKTAAANPAVVLGIAQHDSVAVYDQITTGLQGVFGASQENTPLFPGTPGEVLVVTLGAGIIVAINLPATTGWVSGGTNQANIGTAVGLNIDSTTGFFYADDQESNKVATIVGKIIGPQALFGTVGDLAARVYVSFTPADLQIFSGH
jgi:hypothetical protein